MKRKTSVLKLLIAVLLTSFLSSCASIMSTNIWPLTISSDPAKAKIRILDRKGVLVYSGLTPTTVDLKSNAGFFTRQFYKIEFSMEGYETKVVEIKSELNEWYFGNILWGGLIGIFIVDPATGAMYKLKINNLSTELVKTTASTNPTIQILNIADIPDSMHKDLVRIN